MDETMLEGIKDILEMTLKTGKDLPTSPCDEHVSENGHVTVFRKTLDFEKGQRQVAHVLLEFINNAK